jgi:hypothetical protein
MDVHTVYTKHTIHIVYTVYTVHTMHTVLTVHTMNTIHTIHAVHTVHTIQTLYSRIPGIQDFKTSELGTSRMPTAELKKWRHGHSWMSMLYILYIQYTLYILYILYILYKHCTPGFQASRTSRLLNLGLHECRLRNLKNGEMDIHGCPCCIYCTYNTHCIYCIYCIYYTNTVLPDSRHPGLQDFRTWDFTNADCGT